MLDGEQFTAAALCIGGTAFAASAQSWFPLLFTHGGDAGLEGYVQMADNAKLADKLNSVAGAAIDTIVEVMQATDTPNEAKLKAAQTLLKARQDVTDHLLKDEEKKRESSFDPFADHVSL